MQHDVTLKDAELTLRPLTEADIPALCGLATEHRDELALMGTLPNTPTYYRSGLEAPDQQVFVIEVGGELAGSTRFGDIRTAHSGLEIGWTWLAPRYYGTGINRRMKKLMLEEAFERMSMQRVQLKTGNRNIRSQRAIAGLGAVREGVLRRHVRRDDGSMRDSVMFSVLADEWPAVKAQLVHGLRSTLIRQ
ncbi:GNAT family protein [Deinococcus sp.]|uniref:GNAT family N-acetyltransferase n=1 Tax=Deinococcus sp. TaxID=47478 RepID=UPI0025BD7B70|nr:GNAT family protein [Deinococcus sp.]